MTLKVAQKEQSVGRAELAAYGEEQHVGKRRVGKDTREQKIKGKSKDKPPYGKSKRTVLVKTETRALLAHLSRERGRHLPP